MAAPTPAAPAGASSSSSSSSSSASASAPAPASADAAGGASDLYDGWVYRALSDVEGASPCRLAGMAVSVERQLRETSCRDIVTFVGALATRWARAGSAGSAGGARQRTFPSRIRVIQVASIFFHRGCTRLCLAEDSPIVVAVTCVFLAAKVEEAKHIRLRDVLSTCRDIAQLTDGAPRSAGLKDRMRGIRIGVDDILVMERRLLHAIAFEIFIKTPTQALAKIKGVRKSDRVMVARFIADSLRTSLCLQFPPGVMARAAVFSAFAQRRCAAAARTAEWSRRRSRSLSAFVCGWHAGGCRRGLVVPADA